MKGSKVLRYPITLLLICLCFHCAGALAELRPMEWQRVEQTLDCEGFPVQIDAVTDLNIPTNASEWTAAEPQWTEEGLRRFVAAASPGDENMALRPNPYGELRLFDDILITHAGASNGLIDVTHASLLDTYDDARGGGCEFAILHEQAGVSVPDLALFTFDNALSRMEPVLDALGYEAGMPSYVEAWNASVLQQNHDTLNRWFPENNKNHVWTDAEEMYQISFPVYLDGIRLHRGDREIHNGLWVCSSEITCALTADQILFVRATDCTFDNLRPVDAPQPVLPLEDAIEAYRQMRANMFWDNAQPLVIDKILLEYVVLKDNQSNPITYQLIPAWCFYYKAAYEMESPDGTVSCFQYCADKLHAVTGEPLVY